MKTEKNKLAYRRKAPATTGAFISSVTLKPPKMPSNTMRHFAHLPPDIGHFNASQQSQMHATAAKSRQTIPYPQNLLIPSMQPPNTSLPIAVTDAIAFHQQAANQLRCHHLGGAAEEGVAEVLGERGGYGTGSVSEP